MNYQKILLGVVVVIILYLVYVYIFADQTSTNLFSGGNAQNVKKIDASTLSGDPAAVNFTYSIWIYVNSWQYRYGNTKTIYRRVDSTSSNVSPEVALAASTNDLSITITTGSNPGGEEARIMENS